MNDTDIIGEDDESTIFGMAFAHCEDDFSTFQERRVLFSSLPHYPVHSNNDRGTIFSQKVFLMSRGKLASVFGEEKTKWDFLPQFFGLQNVSEGNHINKISKPMLKIIDAYVDGVNYYAALHWKQVLRPDLFPISRSDIIVGFALKLPGFVKADRFFNFLNQEDPAYMISSRGRYATEQEKSLRDDQGGEPMVIVPSSGDFLSLESLSILFVSLLTQPNSHKRSESSVGRGHPPSWIQHVGNEQQKNSRSSDLSEHQ